MVVMHPSYFPNVAQMALWVQNEDIYFEVCDHYQKQTYRNRCDIYSANGKLSLSIPVNFTQNLRQQYKDVRISNKENWRLQHLKSLQSAYLKSPFFEFYIDELTPLFQNSSDFLLDHNLKVLDVLQGCLQTSFRFQLTEVFQTDISPEKDFRPLINAKRQHNQGFDAYTQVFSEKHGFLPNLSVLDLLFNEGPNTLNYLEQQQF